MGDRFRRAWRRFRCWRGQHRSQLIYIGHTLYRDCAWCGKPLPLTKDMITFFYIERDKWFGPNYQTRSHKDYRHEDPPRPLTHDDAP